MIRYWTTHWKFSGWRPDVNREGRPVRSSGSNSYRKRNVSVGDAVYVVSMADGQLYLGGRMSVKRIVSRAEAVKIWGNPHLFDAEEWIIDPDETGTPLHLHRRLSPALTRQLKFISQKSGPKPFFFTSDTHLDNQATRGVHELTLESATLLDQIINATDRVPRTDRLITVTDEMLRDADGRQDGAKFSLPEEFPPDFEYLEGSAQQINVNRYERDPRARQACINHYGARCFICDFDFESAYGEAMVGFIHVHHIVPLSAIGKKYRVDPVRDLRPVCPNCHAVVHRTNPPFSPEEVRRLVLQRRGAA